MHRFSYNSDAASLIPGLRLIPFLASISLTYFIRSRSSGDAALGNGKPTTTTALARSSAKFRPSESFAPMTAKRMAPSRFLLLSVVPYKCSNLSGNVLVSVHKDVSYQILASCSRSIFMQDFFNIRRTLWFHEDLHRTSRQHIRLHVLYIVIHLFLDP